MDKKKKSFIEETIKELEEKIKSFRTTKEFLDFAAAMSRFHSYSFHNQMLILSQKPEATNVAGFVTWKKMGRYVKKGEKGIMILVPIIHTKEQPDSEGNEQEITTWFKTGHVFDVSQTDGEDLPEISLDVEDQGDAFYNACLELAEQHHIGVKTIENLEHYGVSRNGEVLLREEDNRTSMATTCIHELAHEHLHYDEEGKKLDRETKELEAETVAYIVCSRFGIEPPSHKYLASWQKNHSIMESLKRISQCSQKIIQELEVIMTEAEEPIPAVL